MTGNSESMEPPTIPGLCGKWSLNGVHVCVCVVDDSEYNRQNNIKALRVRVKSTRFVSRAGKWLRKNLGFLGFLKT